MIVLQYTRANEVVDPTNKYNVRSDVRWSRHIPKENVVGLIPAASQFIPPGSGLTTWQVTDSYDDLNMHETAVAGSYDACIAELEARYPPPVPGLTKVAAAYCDRASICDDMFAPNVAMYTSDGKVYAHDTIPKYVAYAREFIILPHWALTRDYQFAKPGEHGPYYQSMTTEEIDETVELARTHGDILLCGTESLWIRHNAHLSRPCKIRTSAMFNGEQVVAYDAGIEKRREKSSESRKRTNARKAKRRDALGAANSVIWSAQRAVLAACVDGYSQIIEYAIKRCNLVNVHAVYESIRIAAKSEVAAAELERYATASCRDDFIGQEGCITLYMTIELYNAMQPRRKYAYRKFPEWQKMIDTIAAVPADALPGEWGCIPGFDKFIEAEREILAQIKRRRKRDA